MTSRHHHLMRPTLSLATFILPETLARPVLQRQLILRRPDAWVVRSRSLSSRPFATTCSASNSSSASTARTAVQRTPSSNTTRRATQYNVYDTRRIADRPQQTSPKKDPSRKKNSNSSSGSKDRKWDAKTDKEIIRLHESGMSWADIDATMNRPPSSCYYRYHTSLDPHLEAWKLSNGQPNTAMIKRLVYLVEVEKHTFGQIQDLQLMHQPWQTPTAFAPQTVLEALATSEAQGSSSGPTATLDSAGGTQKKDERHVVFNKIALHKKYTDYKALQAATSLRENQELYHKALRRGVEIYGENWKKVTECADSLLQQWLPSATRMPLTSNKVASDFRNLQRQGVEWGLEDDVVMARKILQLKKDKPGIWSILERPLQGQDDEQRRYWSEISLALGNHSPEQCKRRWDGLLQLADEEKSAQSKSWHRFERFQFWMLWKHFYLQNLHLMRKDYPLTDVLELSRTCGKLSFSKEISRWMRHRNKATCEKFFRSTVNSALELGINPTDLEKYLLERRQSLQREKQSRQQQQQQHHGKQEQQEQHDQKAAAAESTLTRAKLGDSILLQVAEPMMAKMSSISSENERSTRKDHHQRMVRSDWTVERTRALHEVVLQQKQGVQRADFELDWDRIAEQLEVKFADKSPADRMALAEPATPPPILTMTDILEVPPRTNAQPMQQQLQLPPPLFTPKQCQSCWEYISSFAPSSGVTAAATSPASPSSPLSALGPTEGAEAAIPLSSSNSSNRGYDHRDWSDHELLLLQQGVRKYGTSWADVRAQFLPSRSVSDLYQTWLSISVPGTAAAAADKEGSKTILREGGDVIVVDRMSEPDYVGLLSALEKAGSGGTTAGGEESRVFSNAKGSAGDKNEK